MKVLLFIVLEKNSMIFAKSRPEIFVTFVRIRSELGNELLLFMVYLSRILSKNGTLKKGTVCN